MEHDLGFRQLTEMVQKYNLIKLWHIYASLVTKVTNYILRDLTNRKAETIFFFSL